MNHAILRPLAERYPGYSLKYYLGDYLARSFTKEARREIFKFHHQYLLKRIVDSFYEQILESESVLWHEIIDGNEFAISLSFSPAHNVEGDLTLIFKQNNCSLYKISFTIIPGHSIDHLADQVLLIGRIQGAKQQAHVIRNATKTCHDIAPPYLLIAAAESIASALAIDAIGSVSDKEQPGKFGPVAQECLFNYDAFWETLGARKTGTGFYVISVPFPQKPLAQMESSHRRRARRKRQRKNKIAAIVGHTFATKFLTSLGDEKAAHVSIPDGRRALLFDESLSGRRAD